MYTKRIRIANYGPIDHLDIALPFEEDTPKPVVLVGENGSGKSIVLSHIVNGLIVAKDAAFPETPEIEHRKVFKLRSGFYIKSESEYYFGRVDFEDDLFVAELRTRKSKEEYETAPIELSDLVIQDAWNELEPQKNDYFFAAGSTPNNESKVKALFAKRCVLYFPPNRFEDPAWLNEDNLKAQAQYMDLKHIQGHTERRVINYSPLHDNQKWLFEVVYDQRVFELQIANQFIATAQGNLTVPIFSGYFGNATSVYSIALLLVQTITRRQDARFGIGKRRNRVVSLTSDVTGQIVPNIFQLSSGETSLLNLFLSILRDFDVCGTPFSQAADIRGVVVVDEIDLHLHVVLQREILPKLIRMFPNVQFVVTTHSPLFIQGMQEVFGEDGFSLYRLPQGHRISPEEFSEFANAYRAFTETLRFSSDMRAAIEGAQKPMVFVEGSTDTRYIHRASQLLGKEAMLDGIELRDGNGASNLKKIWDTSKHIEFVTQRTVLLFDCDNKDLVNDKRGMLFREVVPMQVDNPVLAGIENLFGRETLRKARLHKSAFIDVDPARTRTVRGELQDLREEWTINKYEKTNLCHWLCENGTQEDFQGFQVILELLEGLLELHTSLPEEGTVTEQASPGSVADVDNAASLEGTP